MNVGPALVALIDAVLIVSMTLVGIRRWPVVWRLRRNPNADIRAGTMALRVGFILFLGWDMLRWIGAAHHGVSLVGAATDSWPWDVAVRTVLIVASAYFGVVRRRRED